MRLAWATDTHLDMALKYYPDQWQKFLFDIRSAGVDALLITGDISTGLEFEGHLKLLVDELGLPIYFVLGNHDFYDGNIRAIRQHVQSPSFRKSNRWKLHYLGTEGSHIPVENGVALIGHDGWGDCKNGNLGSTVFLNDFKYIDELKDLLAWERMAVLNRLGEESAEFLSLRLDEAFAVADKVIVATHVPPFEEAARHNKERTEPNFLPFFTNRSLGDMLRRAATDHPEKQILVVCGHTHTTAEAQILPNLRAWTGGAIYGVPQLHKILDTSTLFA